MGVRYILIHDGEIVDSKIDKLIFTEDTYWDNDMRNPEKFGDETDKFPLVQLQIEDNSETIKDPYTGEIITDWVKGLVASRPLMVHLCQETHQNIAASEFFNIDGTVKEEYANDEEKIYYVYEDRNQEG